MADAPSFTQVAAYKAYVEKFADRLIHKLFFGAPSLALLNPWEGVKGRLVLTELLMNNSLVKRYSKTFEPTAGFSFVPRILNVVNAKVDQQITQKDFEANYMGKWRQKGQTNPTDWPFEAMILDHYFQKIMEEMEVAIWQAVETVTPAAGDNLIVMFDGLLQIIREEVIATNLTPVATGALTNTTINGQIEAMYNQLGTAYKSTTVDIFMSVVDRSKLIQDRRERYGSNVNQTGSENLKLDIGPANFHFLPGIPENAVIITPKANLHYGYDGSMDHTMFRFVQQIRSTEMAIDFNIGTQIGIVDDSVIVVNDQI